MNRASLAALQPSALTSSQSSGTELLAGVGILGFVDVVVCEEKKHEQEQKQEIRENYRTNGIFKV